ncbi:hypothetical protein T492DRAFT_916484 [Pavlovales sp. CCMP2436]|nr:hypothetical protein T492DRAFT_916484 [Pavlovales sp. CCMP2436]
MVARPKPTAADVVRRFRTVRAPLSADEAAARVQRAYRTMSARRRLRENKGRNAATALAMLIASGVSHLANDVLLAPFNMASEELIHRALGKLLAVLVRDYDKRCLLAVLVRDYDKRYS